MSVRAATDDDVPRLVELLGQLFAIESDFTPNRERQKRGLTQLLASDAVVLVAEADSQVVGMVTVQFVVSTAEGTRSAWLEDMVVDEEWRGRGLGSSLLEAACQQAVARGCTRVQLVADDDNAPALAFYSAHGWVATRLRAWRRRLGE